MYTSEERHLSTDADAYPITPDAFLCINLPSLLLYIHLAIPADFLSQSKSASLFCCCISPLLMYSVAQCLTTVLFVLVIMQIKLRQDVGYYHVPW